MTVRLRVLARQFFDIFDMISINLKSRNPIFKECTETFRDTKIKFISNKIKTNEKAEFYYLWKFLRAVKYNLSTPDSSASNLSAAEIRLKALASGL